MYLKINNGAKLIWDYPDYVLYVAILLNNTYSTSKFEVNVLEYFSHLLRTKLKEQNNNFENRGGLVNVFHFVLQLKFEVSMTSGFKDKTRKIYRQQ